MLKDSRFEVTPEVIVQLIEIGAIWGPLKARIPLNELVFFKLASQPFNRDLTAVSRCPILLKNRIFVNLFPLQSWDDLLFDHFYVIVSFYGLLTDLRGLSSSFFRILARFLSVMTLRDRPGGELFLRV